MENLITHNIQLADHSNNNFFDISPNPNTKSMLKKNS